MGLLDDAIRDHLDLKRRRGADPTEVDQAEREALGPVRRDPFENGQDELEASAGAGAYDQDEAVDEDEEHHEPGDERDRADGDWFEGEHPPDEAGEPERPAAAVSHDEPPVDQTRVLPPDEFDEEEAAAFEDPVAPPPPPAGAGAETVEYDVEEAMERESRRPREEAPARTHSEPHEGEPHEGQKEDVLEETPEFLQDTPDHDRLWFEQRPPKDFDFEG